MSEARLDRRYVANLQGKDFPVYAGVLDLAHQMGVRAITTELVQIPSQSNDNTAIVKATVILNDDRVFSDYGDASPKNTSAKVSTALIRMASTRAKGRALRDAVNVGEALAEEIGDVSQEPQSVQRSEPRREQEAASPSAAATDGTGDMCVKCGKAVTKGRAAYCRQAGGAIGCVGCV